MNECEIRELTYHELDTVGGGNFSQGIVNVLSNNNGAEVGVSQSSFFIAVAFGKHHEVHVI